jgi:hypothetical protein
VTCPAAAGLAEPPDQILATESPEQAKDASACSIRDPE